MRTLKSIKEINKFDLYDITVEKDHCFELDNGIIAHNSIHPKQIVSGGVGAYYAANNVWIIGRQQEKDGTEIAGYHFIINVEKSRFVKEKAKIPITVLREGGIHKWSGLFDVALDGGYIIKPAQGWYMKVDKDNNPVGEKFRAKDIINSDDFWEDMFKNTDLKEYIKNKYSVSGNSAIDSGMEYEDEDS